MWWGRIRAVLVSGRWGRGGLGRADPGGMTDALVRSIRMELAWVGSSGRWR